MKLSLPEVNTVEFRNRSEVHLALSNFGKKIMEANCHSNYIKRDVAWFDSSGAALIDTILRSTEAALASEPARIQVTDEMVRVGAELHWFIETGHRNFSQLSEAAQGQRLDTMRAALEAALESISA